MAGTALIAMAIATAAVYVALVALLVFAGRRTDARALAGLVPDCLVLVRRLFGDPRVARSSRVLLGALALYLLSPVDLVPDAIPIAGQLDDAVIAALALRHIVRRAGEPLLRQHWPGPERSLALVVRLVRA